MRHHILLYGIALLFSLPTAATQDLHYSQFYHNPLHLNPATTGAFKGNLRAAILYRSQWTSVPVSYRTFAGAVDWKALHRRSSLLSLGFLAQHDRAGDAGLTWTQVGATASVSQALGETQALAAGFGFGFVQRAFDISHLTFKNQWDGDVFNSSAASKETFDKTSGLAPALSAGLHWQFQATATRNRLEAGIGAFHLNRPMVSFADDDSSRLPLRFTAGIQGIVSLTERLDAVGFGAGQQMNKAREIVAGCGLRYSLSSGPANETAVQFSLAIRLGDAFIPALQVERNNWTVGLSYDWNTSRFDLATRGHGGPELAIVYRQVPVPAGKNFKACPIF